MESRDNHECHVLYPKGSPFCQRTMTEESIEQSEELRTLISLEGRDKQRLEAFIDAVFAIAITLLGLDFVLPQLEHSSMAFTDFLGSLFPKFLGYFLAFFLLGVLLSTSWRQFQNIKRADWILLWINVLFLAFIVLVPFATSVLTEFSDITSAVLFFHSVIFLSVLTLWLNWHHVRKHPHFLKKDVTATAMARIHYRNIALLTASVVAIGLAFFTPLYSSLAYLLIIVILMLTSHIGLRKGAVHEELERIEHQR